MDRGAWEWRIGMSKVNSIGWLECDGTVVLRSPEEPENRVLLRSPAMERCMWVVDGLSSVVIEK